MLIRLLSKQTALCVTKSFNALSKQLGFESFKRLFQVVLTDNGHEFEDFMGLEYDPLTGKKRMHLFYCDTNRPDQKAALERNHEFIRTIIPKGKSMASLSNKHVKLMEDHINSYARQSLQNKTPYEIFHFTYGAEICALLKLNKVAPNYVNLKPSLIK